MHVLCTVEFSCCRKRTTEIIFKYCFIWLRWDTSFVSVDGWYGTASWCVWRHRSHAGISWIHVESAPLIHLCRGRSNSDMKWIAPFNRLHVHQWPSLMLRGRHFFALSCICVDAPAAIHNVRLFIDNTSDFVCSDASSSSGEAVDDDLSKDSSRRHCRCWRWDRWRRLVGRMRSRYGVARGPTFRLGPQSGME